MVEGVVVIGGAEGRGNDIDEVEADEDEEEGVEGNVSFRKEDDDNEEADDVNVRRSSVRCSCFLTGVPFFYPHQRSVSQITTLGNSILRFIGVVGGRHCFVAEDGIVR